MTISRMREIWGNKIEKLSDEQVLDFIQQTGKLCDVLLDLALNKDLTHHKKEVYYERRSD